MVAFDKDRIMMLRAGMSVVFALVSFAAVGSGEVAAAGAEDAMSRLEARRQELISLDRLLDPSLRGPHIPDAGDDGDCDGDGSFASDRDGDCNGDGQYWDGRWQFVGCLANYQSGVMAREDHSNCGQCEDSHTVDSNRHCVWLCYGYREVTQSEARWYPEGFRSELAVTRECSDLRGSDVYRMND